MQMAAMNPSRKSGTGTARFLSPATPSRRRATHPKPRTTGASSITRDSLLKVAICPLTAPPWNAAAKTCAVS